MKHAAFWNHKQIREKDAWRNVQGTYDTSEEQEHPPSTQMFT